LYCEWDALRYLQTAMVQLIRPNRPLQMLPTVQIATRPANGIVDSLMESVIVS